jgi:hypothetical protein
MTSWIRPSRWVMICLSTSLDNRHCSGSLLGLFGDAQALAICWKAYFNLTAGSYPKHAIYEEASEWPLRYWKTFS